MAGTEVNIHEEALHSVDVPSVVLMEPTASDSLCSMGRAFEHEACSPDRTVSKHSRNIEEIPVTAWSNDIYVSRLSYVELTVNTGGNYRWKKGRALPGVGVRSSGMQLTWRCCKPFRTCFRPCAEDPEQAAPLKNVKIYQVLEDSVPNLFKDGRPRLQEKAIVGLLQLSGFYGNASKIVSFKGAVQGIVRLLYKNSESNLQILAALTMGNLALRHSSALATVALEGLANLLEDREERDLEANLELQEESASALANICFEGGRSLFNPKTDALPRLLKLLFRHDRKGAQEEATRAVVNLLALVQDNSQKLLDFPSVSVVGGLAGLLDKMDRPSLLDNVVRSLAILSHAPGNANRILKSQYFPQVIQGLVGVINRRQKKEGVLQELALVTLANLSITCSVQIQIADCPGILDELLWCLTSSTNDGVIQHAALALGNLAIAGHNRSKIANHNGTLRALVDAMTDDTNPGGQESAAYALANLSHEHESNQLEIADLPGVMKGLARLLKLRSSPGLHQQGARLLANLSYPQENHAKIKTYPGALRCLTELLQRHYNSIQQRDVNSVYANLNYPHDIEVRQPSCGGRLRTPLLKEMSCWNRGNVPIRPSWECDMSVAVPTDATEKSTG